MELLILDDDDVAFVVVVMDVADDDGGGGVELLCRMYNFNSLCLLRFTMDSNE